jgi:hypothetical protein
MDIKNKTILVLGGWGLVGSAICRNLVEEQPKRIIVASLLESEARDAVRALQKLFPNLGSRYFVPWWGNIFLRHELKDQPRLELLQDSRTRAKIIDDLLDELSAPVLKRSALYQLLKQYAPDIVIDCINSATAIAYQDIFTSARELRNSLKKAKKGQEPAAVEAAERLLATLYVPQLIRHVQILYRSMQEVRTKIYVKIGTSGTGGMGLNIPYTHSEERPSSVLLSKSSVAGAHTMLLFLMGRTPDAPITKEIKPTAAIAWKGIGYGVVRRGSRAIPLFDCPPEKGIRLAGTLTLSPETGPWTAKDENLRSVFIDTGENGIFSRGEFEAISTPGQMEFVTPEEIAESVIYEIKGGNTGHDIINALDNATLNPTYRAGFLFQRAREEMKRLEEEHNISSVAFEFLGPPRLSKLLYEAHLLFLAFGTMKTVLRTPAQEIASKIETILRSNAQLRSEIISIGIPILMADGKTLLRGPKIKIPPYRGEGEFPIAQGSVDTWAHDGWVDLRLKNMERWKSRFTTITEETGSIPVGETSSRQLRNLVYWNNFGEIDPGKLAGWIFTVEEKGKRMKA